MSDKSLKRAKVLLKGSKTYTLAGKKFIKDVPAIVKGSDVERFESNGHFKVTHLKDKSVDEDEAPSSSPSPSKKLLKKKKKKK